MRRGRPSPWVWVVTLLVVLVPYLPVLDGDFLQDDYGALRYITVGGEVSWPRVLGFFFPRHLHRDEFLRPLPVLSAAVDLTLFGPDPWAFHAGNLLLHGATALAVGLLARRLLGRPGAGPAAALVYGLYPAQAESVCWIAHRMVGLCVFFTVVALLLHLRGRPLLAALAGLAALLAKEPGVVLPWVVVLVETLGPRRRPLGGALLRALPAAGAVVVYALWKLAVFGRLVTGYGAYPTYFAYFLGEEVYRDLPAAFLRFFLPLNTEVLPRPLVFVQGAALAAALLLLGRPRSTLRGRGRPLGLAALWALGGLLLVVPFLRVTAGLTNSRHFTPAVPALALAGAWLWSAGRRRRAALLAFLVFVAPLPVHVGVYREAGRLARTVRAGVWARARHYPPETTVVVARTPSLHRGAPVFGDGTSLAAALAPPFVPQPLRVAATLDDPPGDPDSVLYTLTGRRAALLVTPDGVVEVAPPSHGWWYPAPVGLRLEAPPWQALVRLRTDPPFVFRAPRPFPWFRLVFRRGSRLYPLLLRTARHLRRTPTGAYEYRLSRGAEGRPEPLHRRPEAAGAAVWEWWVEAVEDPTRPRSARLRSPMGIFTAPD